MTASGVLEIGSQRRELEYVYQDGDGFVLFDPASEMLITVPEACAASLARYFKEGDRVGVLFYAGQPQFLDLPASVHLRVADTDAPATAGSKTAFLETGVKMRVPAFIAAGDVVVVDPRTGVYLGRTSS